MKLIALSSVAVALVTLFGGCATGEKAHYTRSQRAMQHAEYDPTDRASVSRY